MTGPSRNVPQSSTGSSAVPNRRHRPQYISRRAKNSIVQTITPMLNSQPTTGICIAPFAPKRHDSDASARGNRLRLSGGSKSHQPASYASDMPICT